MLQLLQVVSDCVARSQHDKTALDGLANQNTPLTIAGLINLLRCHLAILIYLPLNTGSYHIMTTRLGKIGCSID